MGDKEEISLTRLPLLQSLTEHPLTAGCPKSVLAMLGIVSVMFIILFGFWYIFVITVPIYFLCVYIAQDDPQVFDCYQKYITKSGYYST